MTYHVMKRNEPKKGRQREQIERVTPAKPFDRTDVAGQKETDKPAELESDIEPGSCALSPILAQPVAEQSVRTANGTRMHNAHQQPSDHEWHDAQIEHKRCDQSQQSRTDNSVTDQLLSTMELLTESPHWQLKGRITCENDNESIIIAFN